MRARLAWNWSCIPERRANTSVKGGLITWVVSYPERQKMS